PDDLDHRGGAGAASLRPGRARALHAPARGRLCRPARSPAVPRRPVEPDLLPDGGRQRVRPAPQAAGQAPALGARGGARVPRHHGARPDGVPGAAHARALRGPSVIGTAFYVMDCVHGRVITDPAIPGLSPRERAAIYESLGEVLARLHTVDWQAREDL